MKFDVWGMLGANFHAQPEIFRFPRTSFILFHTPWWGSCCEFERQISKNCSWLESSTFEVRQTRARTWQCCNHTAGLWHTVPQSMPCKREPALVWSVTITFTISFIKITKSSTTTFWRRRSYIWNSTNTENIRMKRHGILCICPSLTTQESVGKLSAWTMR